MARGVYASYGPITYSTTTSPVVLNPSIPLKELYEDFILTLSPDPPIELFSMALAQVTNRPMKKRLLPDTKLTWRR